MLVDRRDRPLVTLSRTFVMPADPRGRPVVDPTPSNEPVETIPLEPERASDAAGTAANDDLDEQEDESFPASDPHSDWAGPPT
jgi:hypothetical protein